MVRRRMSKAPRLAALGLALSCSNPAGFIKSVKDEVKSALKMYLEVKGFSPSKNAAAVSPTALIVLDVDRDIDLATVTPSTISISDASGATIPWSAAFNAVTKQLTLTPSLPSEVVTYTVFLTKGLKAVDGAELQDPLAWSFTTKKGPIGSFAINAGASYANSTAVTLSLTANGEVAKVFASLNEADFAADHSWYSLTGATYPDPVTLSAGDGEKTVYMQFANSASPPDTSRVMSDAIVLDTTAPVVEAGASALPWNAATTSVASAATVTEAHPNTYKWSLVSGPGTVTISSPNSIDTSVLDVAVDGSYVLQLMATDAAGNSVSDSVNLIRDTIAPTVDAGPAIGLNAAALSKATAAVNSEASATSAYAWTMVSGPASGVVTFSPSASVYNPMVSASVDGDYVLQLTATDGVGNPASDTVSLKRDTSLPGVSAGPNLKINIATPGATATTVAIGSGAAPTYAWTQVSGPGTISFGTPAALNTTVSADLDGTYTISLTISVLGVTNHSETQVIRDLVAPAIASANSGGASLLFRDLLNLSAAASDATSGIASYAWAQTSGGGSLSFSPSSDVANPSIGASADGSYKVALTVTDGAGNSTTAAALDIAKDSIPPNAPTVSGLTPTNDATPAWNWTTNGGGNGSFRYQLDATDGSWTETTAFSFSPATDLSADAHTLFVQERDAAGNWSASASFVITVDLTPPSSPPTLTGAAFTNDTTPTWIWEDVDGAGYYRYQLDSTSGAWSATTTSTSYTPASVLGAAAHTLYLQESDAAGNWSSTASFTINIDVTPPSAPEVFGSTPTSDTTPTWIWNSVDGDGFFRYQVDSTLAGGWSAETAASSYTPTVAWASSTHSLYVQERDAAGNWSASASFPITIDTTMPNAPVVTAPNPTNNTMPTWTWTAGGGGGGGKFLFALDSTVRPAGTGSAVTSYTPSSALSQANHYLCVWESNVNGTTWSGYGYAYSLVDTTAPTAPTAAGTTPTNDTTPTWTWTRGTGGNGTLRYQLDSEAGTWTTTTALTYTPAAALTTNVAHTLYVQERDAAGNWSLSGSKALVIDTTPPASPIWTDMTPMAGYTDRSTTNDTTPTWTWRTGGGGVGTFSYGLDTTVRPATTTTATSYTPASALTEGSHYLRVWECDDVGNWSSYGYWYWIVDTTAPTAATITGPATPSIDRTPTWSWTAGAGGDGRFSYFLYYSTSIIVNGNIVTMNTTVVDWTTSAAVTSYTHATALADRTYYFKVREFDAAGNVATSTNTLVIDGVPGTPTATNDAMTVSPYVVETTPTWNWTANASGFGNGTFSYRLYNYTDAVDVVAWTTAAAVTTYTPMTALLDDKTYYFYVREYDANGDYSANGTRSIIVKPVYPYAGQTAVSRNPTLFWRALASKGRSQSYFVQYSLNGSTWNAINSTGITVTTLAVTGITLPANTLIYWRVGYTNTLGNTAYWPSSTGSTFTTGL